jgi:hypothetical protein
VAARAGFEVDDQIALHTTLTVEFKQTVVEPLLAVDELVVHRAIALAAF